MNAFCQFNSTRSNYSGFTVRFFQETKTPLQIVRDSLNNLILPVLTNKPLKIEVKNKSHHYRGIIITLGGYNLTTVSSLKASKTFDEGLYEVKPKETIVIQNKYNNMLTKEGERPLILTNNDLGSYLCVYFKSGNPQYTGDHDITDDPDWIDYTKKANSLISVKLVTLEEIPTHDYQLMAA